MISTVEKVLFLKGVDLFASIPGEQLTSIAVATREQTAFAGETIVHEGDDGDALYLIVSGTARVHTHAQTLATLCERQFFGEMSLLDAEPRSASVTADTDLTLLKIHRADFDEILALCPEISRAVIRVLTHRLRRANQRTVQPPLPFAAGDS